MSTIPGVTVVTTPSPITIQVTAETTPTLISTYLTPLLTALEITVPSGSFVGSFNFNVNAFNGTSNARVGFANIPPSGSVGLKGIRQQ